MHLKNLYILHFDPISSSSQENVFANFPYFCKRKTFSVWTHTCISHIFQLFHRKSFELQVGNSVQGFPAATSSTFCQHQPHQSCTINCPTKAKADWRRSRGTSPLSVTSHRGHRPTIDFLTFRRDSCATAEPFRAFFLTPCTALWTSET